MIKVNLSTVICGPVNSNLWTKYMISPIDKISLPMKTEIIVFLRKRG